MHGHKVAGRIIQFGAHLLAPSAKSYLYPFGNPGSAKSRLDGPETPRDVECKV